MPASADISGTVAIGSEVVLSESTDRADLLQITGTTSTWAGIQIRNSSSEGRWSFMTDGALAGIYDDENNDWYMQFNELGATEIFHNSAQKLTTTTGGVTVTGLLSSTTVTASGLITADSFLSGLGTAASPAIQVGDTNTGFYDSGANFIGVSCNGALEYEFQPTTLDLKNNTLTNAGHVYVNGNIYHTGDTNTYIQFTTDRIRIAAGGFLLLNCIETGGNSYVELANRVRVTTSGNLECEGNITAYSTTSISDINQKANIQKIESPINKIKQISGYTFDWKNSGEHSGGVIAQEIEHIMPSVVKETSIRDGDKMKAVDYQAIIGLLVETVKDLNKRLEDLENGNN